MSLATPPTIPILSMAAPGNTVRLQSSAMTQWTSRALRHNVTRAGQCCAHVHISTGLVRVYKRLFLLWKRGSPISCGKAAITASRGVGYLRAARVMYLSAIRELRADPSGSGSIINREPVDSRRYRRQSMRDDVGRRAGLLFTRSPRNKRISDRAIECFGT